MLGKNRRGQTRPRVRSLVPAGSVQSIARAVRTPTSGRSAVLQSPPHRGRTAREGKEAPDRRFGKTRPCDILFRNEQDNHRLPSCRCSRKRENNPRSLASHATSLQETRLPELWLKPQVFEAKTRLQQKRHAQRLPPHHETRREINLRSPLHSALADNDRQRKNTTFVRRVGQCRNITYRNVE